MFGIPFTDGGDFHVAVDGNFHHRHRRSAGDSARFHKPEYFLSKEQVDKVGVHISKVRKSKPKETQPVVPNEAIDQCKQSHDAANDNKAKSNEEQFDDHGISALVCRHGAPLFTANIDTPGEQQKYAVALIQHFFQHIPGNSTVLVLYDVGCVLNRSLELYDILPPDITTRLAFTTSAMHAYAHQWSCQLVYNPRLREGVGLTDGEGVERLWSRLRKLIGITRTSGRSRRIWLVDRQLDSIGSSHREGLGDWLTRRNTFAQRELAANKTVIRNTGFSTNELRCEWSLQRKAQLSVQAHAPMRLKQELDSILNLQSELDSLDTTIEATKRALSKGTTPLASTLLPELSITGDRLRTQADRIYDTLNVQNRFPELRQCSLEFVRILLVLRDLKINIRKRAIGSFFEWDKLDQAVASVGTKLHQRTRNAITKRRPALLTAINKFNSLCGTLEKLHDPTWLVPLPKPLPTQLSGLRDAQELMEDVWITPSESTVPRWLENVDIRNGIRAMQKVDRCTEEAVRLCREANNMCLWFAAEATAVRQALAAPRNKNLSLRLEQYLTSVERLEARWSCTLITRKRLQGILEQSTNVHSSPSNRETCTTSINYLLEADDPDDDDTPADEARFLEPEAFLLSDLLDDAEASDDPNEPDVVSIEASSSNGTQHGHTATTPTKICKYPALTDSRESCEVMLTNQDQPTLCSLATIDWVLPDNMHIDYNTLPLLRSISYANLVLPSNNAPRAVGRLSMYADSIRLLSDPNAWLDDVCINGCASLLQNFLSAPQLPSSEASKACAIFSTHDLVRLRQNTPDDYFWRQVKTTEYWKKTTWIVPIHRPSPESHWVLCIAQPHTHTLFLFDSFGQRQSWARDVEVAVPQYYCARYLIEARRTS
ncbi:hypothetical protein PTI98_009815 [Pleurotus ostreatus]|nr:hypothetical protein PTI98_009815 [Pleurotus ostreatus]